MERRLVSALLAALMVGSGACVIVDNDTSDGGSGGTGGSGGEGNVTNNGGSPSDGGSGGIGGVPNGNGGAGGMGSECDDFSDCPDPGVECFGASCENGFCASIPLPEGQLCQGTNICDGAGNCVQCITSDDCGAEEICDQGTCTTDAPLAGACGDNLCQLLPAESACVTCFGQEVQAGGSCQVEWQACEDDPGGDFCDSCQEAFNGAGFNDPCAESAAIIQDLLECICTVGVCAE
ncbi:MAG: hypothetical protein HOW73_38470 [Polyangiaceae bacterium]|nr:hypothetical protein [Polyangiaceae bacterium]